MHVPHNRLIKIGRLPDFVSTSSYYHGFIITCRLNAVFNRVTSIPSTVSFGVLHTGLNYFTLFNNYIMTFLTKTSLMQQNSKYADDNIIINIQDYS